MKVVAHRLAPPRLAVHNVDECRFYGLFMDHERSGCKVWQGEGGGGGAVLPEHQPRELAH